MDKYQLVRDFYLVWVDRIWEDRKTKSGIITSALAVSNNSVKDHNALEELEDRGEYKRRFGRVIEVPASFSDADVDMIDPGLPQPRRYVSHDWIQGMKLAGWRGYRDHENPLDKYYPSTFERYEVITTSDIAKCVDVKVGDKIYFEHTCTDKERYMGRFDGGHVFSVRVNEVLCAIREVSIFQGSPKYKRDRIFPQGGWVFVKLNMEDWKDITTPGGIIVKCAPEALPLKGTVVAAQKKELEGKSILFEADSDAPVIVEGRDLTCMRESEILATIKP